MPNHPIVSQEEWLTARKALLLKEKEATHLRDQLNAARLALPWVKVDKPYEFDTPNGKRTLADLFEGRSQLIVYHFMLGPGWKAGCPGCSFIADGFDATLPHLNHHDVTLTSVSRAALPEIEAYKHRMNWHFPWASSNASDFNFDFHVSFTPEEIAAGHATYNFGDFKPPRDGEMFGMSAFIKDADGTIYHTYSSYHRGFEEWLGTLMILDRAPLGRNEKSTMDFVKRHDEYEQQPKAATYCH